MIDNTPWDIYFKHFDGIGRFLLFIVCMAILQAELYALILLAIHKVFSILQTTDSLRQLAISGFTVICLYLLSAASELWLRFSTGKMNLRVISLMRNELVNRFFLLPRVYYDSADKNLMHEYAVIDTERIDTMCNALTQSITALFVVLSMSIALALLNPWLFMLLFFLFSSIALIERTLGQRLKQQVDLFFIKFAKFSKLIAHLLHILELTRLRAMEGREMSNVSKSAQELGTTTMQLVRIKSLYDIALPRLLECTGIIVLIAGGFIVSLGKWDIGGLMCFYVASVLIKNHLSTLSRNLPRIIEGASSLSRIHNFLQIDSAEPYAGSCKHTFKNTIELRQVSFGFYGHPLLINTDLIIEKGSTIFLTGQSGIGKTTLTNLILGFYRPHSGKLYVDGYPYENLDIRYLRSQFGVVRQEPSIFAGTVLENITYGHPGVCEAEVVKAAKLAAADEFIGLLPSGYSSFIGENGITLSAGQRQRLAIARALIGKPSLLVLDEPMTHLDAATALQIMKNIQMMASDVALLIITHHMNIIQEFSSAFQLKNGYLTELSLK